MDIRYPQNQLFNLSNLKRGDDKILIGSLQTNFISFISIKLFCVFSTDTEDLKVCFDERFSYYYKGLPKFSYFCYQVNSTGIIPGGYIEIIL